MTTTVIIDGVKVTGTMDEIIEKLKRSEIRLRLKSEYYTGAEARKYALAAQSVQKDIRCLEVANKIWSTPYCRRVCGELHVAKK